MMTSPREPLSQPELEAMHRQGEVSMDAMQERRKKALNDAESWLGSQHNSNLLTVEERTRLSIEVASYLTGERPRMPDVPRPGLGADKG
jgi:hypothetical protein